VAAPQRHDPKVWGISLMAFAICFVIGTLLGGRYRYSEAILRVPWDNTKPDDIPKTPQEAWLWISFANDALAYGVKTEDVKAIYRRTKDSSTAVNTENVPWPSYPSTRPARPSGAFVAPPSPSPSPSPSPLPSPEPTAEPQWPSYRSTTKETKDRSVPLPTNPPSTRPRPAQSPR